MKKAIKGTFGYLKVKRNHVLLRTLLFFFISLSLLIAGIVQTGGKENLLTIVAVLGCLPACKSLVEFIMYCKAAKYGCTEELKKQLCREEGRLIGMYDMYFTSYQKNFPISHMVVEGKNICGYCAKPDCDLKKGEEHLLTMLKQGGYKDMTVKFFSDPSKYAERLRQLNGLTHEAAPERDDAVRCVLYDISL